MQFGILRLEHQEVRMQILTTDISIFVQLKPFS